MAVSKKKIIALTFLGLAIGRYASERRKRRAFLLDRLISK